MLPAPHEATGQIVAGSRGTWLAESTLGLGLIRPRSHRLALRSITDLRHTPLAIDQLANGAGRLWSYGMTTHATGAGIVLTGRALLTAIDEKTEKITRQLAVPAGPYDMAYGNGALFLANSRTGRLIRVNRNYTIDQLRPIRPAGRLLTVAPGAVWTATRAGKLHRTALP